MTDLELAEQLKKTRLAVERCEAATFERDVEKDALVTLAEFDGLTADDLVAERHGDLIGDANEALDKIGTLTPGDLIRPFVEWLGFLIEVGEAAEAVEFAHEIDAALHERAVKLSRTLDKAGDLVAMYTEAHVVPSEDGHSAGLHARGVFETVTRSHGLRRDVLSNDDYFGIVADTAKLQEIAG